MMVAKRGDIQTKGLGGLQEGLPFLCLNFLVVYGEFDHFCYLLRYDRIERTFFVAHSTRNTRVCIN